MRDLVESVGLESLIRDLGGDPTADFEATYSRLASTHGTNSPGLVKLGRRIQKYFQDISLPARVTIYDRLLLSLRPTDIIATFNWDPLLVLAMARNQAVTQLPRVVFLHGNCAIGYCTTCKSKGLRGTRCKRCGIAFKESPLLLPVQDKDYTSNPFVAAEWSELRGHLGRAYYLTVFGYAAPQTDRAAREALLTTWQSSSHYSQAEVEIIDIAHRRTLKDRWNPFFVRDHRKWTKSLGRSWLLRHPRRTCEALHAAMLMCSPWADDWMPQFSRLESLHAWVEPYLREEREGQLRGHIRASPFDPRVAVVKKRGSRRKVR